MQIINITANGNFNTIDLPTSYGQFMVQARSSADISVRVINTTTVWTIKSGTIATFPGTLGALGLQFQANNGAVIEIAMGFSSRDTI